MREIARSQCVISTVLIIISIFGIQLFTALLHEIGTASTSRKGNADSMNKLHHDSTNNTNETATANINKKDLMQYKMYKPTLTNRSVVIKKYKLFFVLMPKCASSSTRELLARMNGQEVVPGVTRYGDLLNFTTLDQFSPDEAVEILTSPNWTRVAILRDPKDRLLSAYLDKEKDFQDNPWRIKSHKISSFKKFCCRNVKNTMTISECHNHTYNFTEFVKITRVCQNIHWNPQKNLIDNWDVINYPISMNNLAVDTERMLRHLGDDVWEKFGATGWGFNGTNAIFQQNTRHSSNANSAFDLYYNEELERIVEKEYAEDYKLLHKFFPEERYKT